MVLAMSDSTGDLGIALKELKVGKHNNVPDPGDPKHETLEHQPRSIEVSLMVKRMSNKLQGTGNPKKASQPSSSKNDEQLEEEHEDPGSDSSGEWQTMPAISSFDIYNDKGELAIASRRSNQPALSSNNASNTSLEQSPRKQHTSTFGYTKVADEEQAQRSYQTDKKTDFLFNHKLMNNSVRSLNKNDTDEEYDEFEDEMEQSNDLNATSQLNVTKNLLTDKEKFAYLGSINVLVNQMCTDLATVCLSTNVTAHKKLARRLQKVQKNMGEWKTGVLSRLYDHLGVSVQEIQMIEKLALHGIQLQDLCKCLKVTQVVMNPWEISPSEDDTTKEEAKLPENPQITSDVKNPQRANNSVPCEIVQPTDIKQQSQLEMDVAWTIVCDLFLLLLSDSTYDSRSRTLLIKFAEVLNITKTEVCEFERRVTDALEMEQSTETQVWNEVEHMDKRRKRSRKKKLCYVGLATIGGSLVLGLSGGLLAPVIGAGIAAGLSTVGITGATGFLTGVGGTAVVAATSTAIGAKIGTQSMSKRMGSVRTFEFKPLHNNRRVNLVVSVSGWMIGNEDDVRLPFSTVDPVEGDLYSLHWEPEMLKSTGQTINILASEIFTQTIQQILGATILTAFMSAIQTPMMLSKLGYIIDNPWNVSLDRAWSAGLILADTLISKNLGQRPITLIGFSLGSRVIYSCLVELCKRNAIGLVENVFLFGSPVVYNRDELVMARSIVSGRFVNGYSDKDWVLCYLFRATGGGFKRVAGVSPISGIEGIENVNCTELVEGHMAYRKNMPRLLKMLGISVVSEEFEEIDDSPDPEEVKRQRKLVHDLDEAQKKLSKKKRNSWVPKWFKPKKAKWQEMCEETTLSQENDKTEYELEKTHQPAQDQAIVDTSALMRELEKIKKETQRELDEVSTCEPSGPKEQQDTHKFQLLNAGKTVLPEDETIESRANKKGEAVTFAFSDDF